MNRADRRHFAAVASSNFTTKPTAGPPSRPPRSRAAEPGRRSSTWRFRAAAAMAPSPGVCSIACSRKATGVRRHQRDERRRGQRRRARRRPGRRRARRREEGAADLLAKGVRAFGARPFPPSADRQSEPGIRPGTLSRLHVYGTADLLRVALSDQSVQLSIRSRTCWRKRSTSSGSARSQRSNCSFPRPMWRLPRSKIFQR